MSAPVVGYDALRDSRHRTARAARECADWLAWLELEGKAPRTLDDYERTVAVLLRMFPNHQLDEIGDSELLHTLKTFPAGSRRIRRAHLASFIGWAYKTGRLERNPLDLVPRPKRRARQMIEVFSDAERVLLEGLPSPDGPLFSLLFRTGIRKGEARNLKAKHIDLERGILVVLNGKGGKDRMVPIGSLAAILAEWFLLDAIKPDDYLWYTRPGGGRHLSRRRPIGEGSMHRWYADGIERAGVRYRKLHTTRHTFATSWLRAGGRLETLSLILGHASIKTTYDEYAHLDMRDIMADLALVES